MKVELHNLSVEKSELSDVILLKNNLRKSDINEIWLAEKITPEKALLKGYVHSEPCLTLKKNGIPIAMFGVVPDKDQKGLGMIWMLGSDEIDTVKKSFVRISVEAINALFGLYSMMGNFVFSGNFKTLDWLACLGAEFSEPISHGPFKAPFNIFKFKRGDAHV